MWTIPWPEIQPKIDTFAGQIVEADASGRVEPVIGPESKLPMRLAREGKRFKVFKLVKVS